MPNKIAVTHPKTGRTIHVPREQLPGLKAAGWGDPVADESSGPSKSKTSATRSPTAAPVTNESQED